MEHFEDKGRHSINVVMSETLPAGTLPVMDFPESMLSVPKPCEPCKNPEVGSPPFSLESKAR